MTSRPFSFLTLGFLLLTCTIPVKAGEIFEEIIARVNNDVITKSDYEKSTELIKRELKKNLSGPEFEKALAFQEKDLLKNMIDEQLLVQKALDLGMTADTEAIKYLDKIRQDYKLENLEELDRLMIQQGIDPEEFKRNIRNHSLRQQVLGREVYSRIQNQISSEEIRKYYEEHLQEFERPEQVRIREIMISTEDKKPEELQALEKKAQEVLQKARSGERFEELATKYSDGPTAKEGGDLGFFPRGKMLAEIEDMAFKLRRGQVSDLIKTKFGLVIIKVEEKHEAGIQKLETVMNEIQGQLFEAKAQPAIKEYLTKVRRQSFIEVKQGYIDSGAVPKPTPTESAQTAQTQSEKGKSDKKKN